MNNFSLSFHQGRFQVTIETRVGCKCADPCEVQTTKIQSCLRIARRAKEKNLTTSHSAQWQLKQGQEVDKQKNKAYYVVMQSSVSSMVKRNRNPNSKTCLCWCLSLPPRKSNDELVTETVLLFQIQSRTVVKTRKPSVSTVMIVCVGVSITRD